jgi:hypothetical protein
MSREWKITLLAVSVALLWSSACYAQGLLPASGFDPGAAGNALISMGMDWARPAFGLGLMGHGLYRYWGGNHHNNTLLEMGLGVVSFFGAPTIINRLPISVGGG